LVQKLAADCAISVYHMNRVNCCCTTSWNINIQKLTLIFQKVM